MQGEIKKQVRSESDYFFNARDDNIIASIFRQYANMSASENTIPRSRLGEALEALGIRLSEEEVDIAFRAADLDLSGGLGLNEFRRVTETPSKMEEWASRLPLTALLGRCLSFTGGRDPLRDIVELEPVDFKAVIQVFSEGTAQLLDEAVAELREIRQAKSKTESSGTSSKFETLLKMSAGNIDSFHEGLAERVGTLLQAVYCNMRFFDATHLSRAFFRHEKTVNISRCLIPLQVHRIRS